MNYNYHAHTFRCNHATGTPEEYILRAIKNGVKYMGFSDHFPYICRDGYEARYRVPMAQKEEYFSELYSLREKYADKIELLIGFEFEYYPDLFDIMLENAVSYGAEYLVLGQHFIGEEHPNGVYSLNPNDNSEHLRIYVDNVVAGIKSGVFSFVAHPDLFNYTGDRAIYDGEMRRICQASLENNVPLEINFLGIRGGRSYPNEAFWSLAGEIGSPVTFGFDSHDTLSAFDAGSLGFAENIVKKYDLNYIGRPAVVLLKNR